jgi:hypothetical protein
MQRLKFNDRLSAAQQRAEPESQTAGSGPLFGPRLARASSRLRYLSRLSTRMRGCYRRMYGRSWISRLPVCERAVRQRREERLLSDISRSDVPFRMGVPPKNGLQVDAPRAARA